jgi:hypothetical protein
VEHGCCAGGEGGGAALIPFETGLTAPAEPVGDDS